MRAPDPSLKEDIEKLANALAGPPVDVDLYQLGPGWEESTIARAMTTRAIEWAIDELRVFHKSGEPLWGNRRKNLKSIAVFRKQIENLQRVVKALPSQVLALLFALEADGSREDIPSAQVQQKALGRLRMFVAMLARLSARCDEIAEDRPGRHQASNYFHEYCAEMAWDLMVQHRKQPASAGDENSLFRRLTDVLLLGATGKRTREDGISVERGCRAVFQRRQNISQPKIERKINR